METLDCVVVGAGVVGLAIAREFARRGRQVYILEEHDSFGRGISSRNSEVIHAGIYYPPGSVKAALCVDGAHRLYEYCEDRGIRHERCGKLLVATSDSQLGALQQLEVNAARNSVKGLKRLGREQVNALEPELNCVGALFSSMTGIVDSHSLMLSLLGDAERDGATFCPRCPVTGGQVTSTGTTVTTGGASAGEFVARTLINAAGLGAQGLARSISGIPSEGVPPLSLAKGNYFALAGKSPFSHLIYPVPDQHGLGVHLTLDLDGRARFGPDVEWVDTIDYRVSADRQHEFYLAIRRYWPQLPDGALVPDFAGIRPKPHLRNESSRDFMISLPEHHGVPGLVNLFGIESPGLTSCLAIGAYVADALTD